VTAREPVAVATAEDVRRAYDDNTFDVVVGHSFAFGSWKRLSRLDRALSGVVPQRCYDNVGITGVKPS
jgi:hypothetical protein